MEVYGEKKKYRRGDLWWKLSADLTDGTKDLPLVKCMKVEEKSRVRGKENGGKKLLFKLRMPGWLPVAVCALIQDTNITKQCELLILICWSRVSR